MERGAEMRCDEYSWGETQRVFGRAGVELVIEEGGRLFSHENDANLPYGAGAFEERRVFGREERDDVLEAGAPLAELFAEPEEEGRSGNGRRQIRKKKPRECSRGLEDVGLRGSTCGRMAGTW